MYFYSKVHAPGFIIVLLCLFCHAIYASQPQYQETFLSVRINGEIIADNSILLQQRDMKLLVNVTDLENWRINYQADDPVLFQGQRYILLNNIQGLRYTLDSSTLTLDIDMPVSNFHQTTLFQRPQNLHPQGSAGAFLNYDIRFSIGDKAKAKLNSFWELMLFKPQALGIFRNTLDVQDMSGQAKVTRLETTWSKDLIERKETITLGDSFSRSSVLGRPVQFGGLKWASNFTLDPRLIRYPTGRISGFTEQEGTAEMYVNGSLRNSFELPRGPFDINQLPNFTGDSNIRVIITDPFGREQLINYNFYISTDNLTQGLSEYSYEAGFLRQQFGKESFRYGKAFVSGTHRYGFSDYFTGGAHFELQKDLQGGGFSGVFVKSRFGRISGKALVSHSWAGTGYDLGFSYDYTTSRFNIGFGSEYRSDRFRQLSNFQSRPPPQRIDIVRFGINLNQYGSFGLNYINRERRNGPDTSSISANYRFNVGRASCIINLFQSIEPQPELTVTASLIVPFSLDYIGIAGVSSQDGTVSGSLELQKNRGASELGTSFRMRAETDGDRYRINGGVLTQTRYNRFVLEGQSNDGNNSMRAGVGGSIALLDGDVFFSRPIDRSFAVVDTTGIKDVSIYQENRYVGKTASNGRLLIPSLNAYTVNSLSFEPDDIPFDATVEGEKTQVAPYFRSGTLVEFPITRSISATITLVDKKGKPLPAGTQLRVNSGQGEGQVAAKGRAYLNNLSPGKLKFTADTGMGKCTFNISISNDMEMLPHLGEVVCQ